MSETGYNILIVDDDQFLLDIYSTKFTQGGFKVDTATSGEEVLSKLREQRRYDAILLDVVMPSMDGITLLENIRKENLDKEAALIVLSNQGQQSDIDKAEQFKVDGYIVKANTIPSEVLEKVVDILKKKKSANN